MNSTAAIKAFTGEHGGTICTSSNADKSWPGPSSRGEKVLFLPDQHLGRNTAVLQRGLSFWTTASCSTPQARAGLSRSNCARRR